MGFLSCTAETAISICDSKNNWEKCDTKPNRPFELREFSYSDLEIATNGFSPENLLGKGSHGFVYRANLENLTAAVKVAKQSEVENEIELLTRIHNPGLVNLIGFGSDLNRRRLLVVEFMPNGSLFDLLHRSDRPVGLNRRVRFAVEIARAVRFCHGFKPPVIHRDIKSSNVLIDGELHARLGDFGLALFGRVNDAPPPATPPAGTLGYLDPEYLSPADLSPKSDVFSFGTLLMELISGRNAIDMNHSPPSVVDWAVARVKSGDFEGILDPRIAPPEDDGGVRQLAVLAARCCRSAAAKRPTMAEVAEKLTAVYRRLKSPVWNSIRRRVDCTRDSTRVAVSYAPLQDDAARKLQTSPHFDPNCERVNHDIKASSHLGPDCERANHGIKTSPYHGTVNHGIKATPHHGTNCERVNRSIVPVWFTEKCFRTRCTQDDTTLDETIELQASSEPGSKCERVSCSKIPVWFTEKSFRKEDTTLVETPTLAVKMSRRTRKVSSVTSVEAENDLIGVKKSHQLVKAKSIGSFAEIGYEPLDQNVGRLGATMCTVRLIKSRSMGMMNSKATKLLMSKTSGSEFEESKLLGDPIGK